MHRPPKRSVVAQARTSHASRLMRVCTAALLLAIGPWSSPALASDEAGQFFEAQVRPLLVEHCQKCHGSKKQEAGLRLDSREAILRGGDTGPAIAPGKPDESLLVAAVRQTGDVQMPPKEKLSDQQVAALVHWVEIGAPWPATATLGGENLAEKQKRHWAFQSIAHPAPPDVPNNDWTKTPVDQFILSRLTSAGLAPSPPADRRSLIRRVTYDLTGLPPSPEQVDEFVRDEAPDAYTRLVDRLLASPQYGEQWARHWLDVARYSDTKGYVYAREERFWVHAATYRDWVVDAFNRDLPYDQFLLQQIAADQAAPQDQAAAAAMGFLTLGRRFLGVTHDVIDDRIDVVMRGTMGLTVACARCHDHKYDPIPTADYYSLYGVFLNSTERLVPAADPPATQSREYSAFAKELAKRQEVLRSSTLAKHTEASDRARQRVTEYLVAQTELSKYPEEGFDQVFYVADVIPMFVRRWEAWLSADERATDKSFLPWRKFAILKSEEFAARSADIVQELSSNPSGINPLVLAALNPPPASMREVAERYGKLLVDVDTQWKATLEAAKAAGMPEPTALPAADAEALRQALYAPDSPCVVPDEPIVATELYFDSDTINALWKAQGDVERWLIQSPLAPPHAVTLVDRELLRPGRVFRRGNPANRGPFVPRHFVSVVAGANPPPFKHGSGRLELAQAIIDPANPLTARVWVNRIWQHHFGTGLVRTASDFGMRADPPSHPELLDWLATRLVADGWSTKKLHRLILLSSTYQQRSDGPAELAERERASGIDPENRLLWRMNSRRLTFEEFRDSLLAITGRLDMQMGGKASDLFAGNGTTHRRRTLYGLVDRQFLPATMRAFDFANPDLHTPARSETTVPQQALFALNHPFVAQQAQALIAKASGGGPLEASEQLKRLYLATYQREPTAEQLAAAMHFVTDDPEPTAPQPREEALAWQYGYGELDPDARQLKSFHALPFFSGSAWQGSAQWPDAKLGWVQLTAQGGHPGNDLAHCSVRRWVAQHDGTYSVMSSPTHQEPQGNGIRCWIFSSRDGALASAPVHNQKIDMNVATVVLKKGDTLDFVVDINGELNSDQHLWAPEIREVTSLAGAAAATPNLWQAERDFTPVVSTLLNRWEQLAQVLLISNELMFVD